MTTNDTHHEVKYLNTSRDNFKKWKRSVDAKLAKHPDRLLPVVQDQELAVATKTKVLQTAAGLGYNPTEVDKLLVETLREADTSAYFIIIDTIACTTTMNTIDRKFGNNNDASGAYDYICNKWALGEAETTDEKLVAKDDERTDFVRKGPESGALHHVTAFVEELLDMNAELEGTEFHWKDSLLVTRLLTAVGKHERSLVDSYRATKAGQSEWKKDFDVVWSEFQKLLEVKTSEKDSEPDSLRNTDTLATNTNQALIDQVAALAVEVSKLRNNRGDERNNRRGELCDHCGVVHKVSKDVPDGCIGKAVSTGKMSKESAVKFMHFLTNPESGVRYAVERYEAHQKTKGGGEGTTKSVKLVKSYNMCTVTAMEDDPDKDRDAHRAFGDSPSGTAVVLGTYPSAPANVKFDTQAQDHILCDRRFFPQGVDSSKILALTTIVPSEGDPPRTQGVGTAYLKTAGGIVLCLENAHLYEGGLHNVVATRQISDTAYIDADSASLVMKVDGTRLPFDSGYCAMDVQPLPAGFLESHTLVWRKTEDPDTKPRHPDAAGALLGQTTALLSAFGGITKGPLTAAGTHSMSNEHLGKLYSDRTGLDARTIKGLHETTDAPERLSRMPRDPVNDDNTLRANMPKQPAKPDHESRRTHVVCFDLNGPHEPSKHGNNRYTVNFVYLHDTGEGPKRKDWHLDYLPSKDKFPLALADFIDTTDLPWKAIQLYTDNEAVLNSKEVKKVVHSRRLKPIRNSCEYEPWQNGAVERPWKTLASTGRKFLLQGFGECERNDGVDPEGYWPYAYQQTADVYKALNDPTGRGRIAHLRVPFCLAYVKTPRRYLTSKLAAQAERCIHLGWSRQKPGYVLEVLEGPRKGKLVVSTQVKFRENVFPLHCSRVQDDSQAPGILIYDDIDRDEDDCPLPARHGDLDDDDDDDDRDSGEDVDDQMPPLGPQGEDDPDTDDHDDDDEGPPPRTRRYPTRATTDLGDWRPIVQGLSRGQTDGSIRVLAVDGTEPSSGKYVPRRFQDIPKIKDTALRNEWFKVHYAENDGLLEKPEGDPVLRVIEKPDYITEAELMYLNTLYSIKADGRLKARTVLSAGKNKLDKLDLGYERTYSPTGRATTLRLLCAIAAIERMTIRGGDVKQAYGQAKWPAHLKKVLSRVPAGYRMYEGGKTYCCEVGNLYGHVIAGKNWYLTIVEWLLGFGFTQSEWDPCFFHLERDGEKFFFLLYVDDVLMFTTEGSDLYPKFEQAFSKDFEWTPFGTNLHDFVSIRIRQSPGVVTLDMEGYITRCVEEAFPGGVHHDYTTPADPDLAQFVAKTVAAKDTTYAKTELGARCRRVLHQELYASLQTRADVALAVGLLSRCTAYPSPELLKRIERVLIYLNGTKALKLTYAATEGAKLNFAWAPRVAVTGYADANFEVAHSTSGYAFTLLAAISWGVKKQESIALTTQQAEIVAGSLAACECVYLRGLLAETGHPPEEPTVLHLDNSSAIDLAFDPVLHAKTKHIDRRDLFVRELVSRKVVVTKFIPTAQNVADVLTKPLPRQAFQKHRAALLGIQE